MSTPGIAAPGGPAATGDQPKPAACNVSGIEDLPPSVLATIFQLVPFAHRHNVLPLVCRSWRDLCAQREPWADGTLPLVAGDEARAVALTLSGLDRARALWVLNPHPLGRRRRQAAASAAALAACCALGVARPATLLRWVAQRVGRVERIVIAPAHERWVGQLLAQLSQPVRLSSLELHMALQAPRWQLGAALGGLAGLRALVLVLPAEECGAELAARPGWEPDALRALLPPGGALTIRAAEW